jgi:uncharacterized protein with von Willebrand factor type A (vWA) domain
LKVSLVFLSQKNNSMIHHLKTWPEHFRAIAAGIKTFELRDNDRNFEIGDELILQEWNQKTESFTGDEIKADIIYILRNAEKIGLRTGYVILQLTLK